MSIYPASTSDSALETVHTRFILERAASPFSVASKSTTSSDHKLRFPCSDEDLRSFGLTPTSGIHSLKETHPRVEFFPLNASDPQTRGLAASILRLAVDQHLQNRVTGRETGILQSSTATADELFERAKLRTKALRADIAKTQVIKLEKQIEQQRHLPRTSDEQHAQWQQLQDALADARQRAADPAPWPKAAPLTTAQQEQVRRVSREEALPQVQYALSSKGLCIFQTHISGESPSVFSYSLKKEVLAIQARLTSPFQQNAAQTVLVLNTEEAALFTKLAEHHDIPVREKAASATEAPALGSSQNVLTLSTQDFQVLSAQIIPKTLSR